MKKFLSFFLLLFVVGCDEAVNEEVVPNSLRQTTGIQSCSYTGFCTDYTGHTHFSSMCNGNQNVDKEIWQVKVTRKSGKVEIDDRDRVLRITSECR